MFLFLLLNEEYIKCVFTEWNLICGNCQLVNNTMFLSASPAFFL